jgi:hypothetical protein
MASERKNPLEFKQFPTIEKMMPFLSNLTVVSWLICLQSIFAHQSVLQWGTDWIIFVPSVLRVREIAVRMSMREVKIHKDTCVFMITKDDMGSKIVAFFHLRDHISSASIACRPCILWILSVTQDIAISYVSIMVFTTIVISWTSVSLRSEINARGPEGSGGSNRER